MPTIHRCYFNMKNLILIIVLIFVTNAFAEARTFKAVVRTENNRATEEMIELENLISDTSFDGEHFRIVKGKSDEAIGVGGRVAGAINAAPGPSDLHDYKIGDAFGHGKGAHEFR